MKNEANKLDIKWLQRALIIGVLDVLFIAGSFFIALWLRFEFRFSEIPREYLEGFLHTIGPWVIICIVVFALFQMYNSIWSFVSVDELFRMILAHGVLLVIGVACILIFDVRMPLSYYFLGFVLSFMCTTGLRFSYRFIRQMRTEILTTSKKVPGKT